MSRTTWIAVATGTLFGGALAWPSRQAPEAPRPTATTPAEPAIGSTPADGSPASAETAAPPAPSESAPSPASTPLPSGTDPLLASPHSRPVQTEGELRAAEVNCDARVADDCIRAADGYEHGVVARDEERITRHRKVGLTLYVHQCDAFDPAACYQLSRLYADGDIVEKNAAASEALVKRARELCQTRNMPFCTALRQSAP